MADRRQSNRRTAAVVVATVVGMVGLAFASVPLYRLFCEASGFWGTPTVARAGAPEVKTSERQITVRFDSNVQPNVPWRFQPVVRQMRVHLGESSLAFFEAENLADVPVVGQATFNVTPHKMGPYFVKIECFCFQEQVLQPGEKVSMPVSFYIDPAIAEYVDTADLETITLSYTFFRAMDEAQKLQAVSPRESGAAPAGDTGRASRTRPNG
jgi:cytochrome c oxidase assembly protein subunit 11